MGEHRSPDEKWQGKQYPFFAWEKSPMELGFSLKNEPDAHHIYRFLQDSGIEFVMQSPDRGINLWRFYFAEEAGRNFFMLYYSEWFTYTSGNISEPK